MCLPPTPFPSAVGQSKLDDSEGVYGLSILGDQGQSTPRALGEAGASFLDPYSRLSQGVAHRALKVTEITMFQELGQALVRTDGQSSDCSGQA